MEQKQEGVVITLKDVYDLTLQTHNAVTGLGPRMKAVEQQSDEALKLARAADGRSKSNEKFIKGLKTIGGTILGGTILALITDWIAKHIH